MKDKRQKKNKQRAKRKAKSEAFFARLKAKQKQQVASPGFNKQNWKVDAKQTQAQKISPVFDKSAWNIGKEDGRTRTSLD